MPVPPGSGPRSGQRREAHFRSVAPGRYLEFRGSPHEMPFLFRRVAKSRPIFRDATW